MRASSVMKSSEDSRTNMPISLVTSAVWRGASKIPAWTTAWIAKLTTLTPTPGRSWVHMREGIPVVCPIHATGSGHQTDLVTNKFRHRDDRETLVVMRGLATRRGNPSRFPYRLLDA